MIVYYGYYTFTAIEVNFSQAVYIVNENSGVVQIQLIFSNPSSIDIAIEVNNEDINATGVFPVKNIFTCYIHNCVNYIYMQ